MRGQYSYYFDNYMIRECNITLSSLDCYETNWVIGQGLL
jgi:hypothetical protein